MTHSRHLVIIGSGIIGLAHAFEAHRRGWRVTVVEADARPVGASIRNFGHCSLSAHPAELDDTTAAARAGWLRASELAGLDVRTDGGLMVARGATEMGLLEEFAAARPGKARLLTRAGVVTQLGSVGDPGSGAVGAPGALGASGASPASGDTGASPALGDTGASGQSGIVGGAVLVDDLRVDPRTTVGTLVDYLAGVGIEFRWRASALSVTGGTVVTSRGTLSADHVLVCVGHDVDRLLPEVADAAQVRRCGLQMMLVEAPATFGTHAAVLTGTSMLRYHGMSTLPTAAEVRKEIAAVSPGLLEIDANVMFAARPDGTLVVGDSHAYDLAIEPFLDESTSDLLLAEVAGILGVPALRVLQRWQGVYASTTTGNPLLRERIDSHTTVVSVTSGVGMTLSFGIAAETLSDL